MTLQTESLHVRDVAFPATFDNGLDVVGVPERLTGAPFPFGGCSDFSGTSQSLQVAKLCHAIDVAAGADAAVALEDPVA